MGRSMQTFVTTVICPVEYPDGIGHVLRGLDGLGYDNLDMFLHEVTTLVFEHIKEAERIDATVKHALNKRPMGHLSYDSYHAYRCHLLDIIPSELEGATMRGMPFEYGEVEFGIIAGVIQALLDAILTYIPTDQLEHNTLTLSRMGRDFIELRMEGPIPHRGHHPW